MILGSISLLYACSGSDPIEPVEEPSTNPYDLNVTADASEASVFEYVDFKFLSGKEPVRMDCKRRTL